MKEQIDADQANTDEIMEQLEMMLAGVSTEKPQYKSFILAQKRMAHIRKRQKVVWESVLLTLGHLDEDYINELTMRRGQPPARRGAGRRASMVQSKEQSATAAGKGGSDSGTNTTPKNKQEEEKVEKKEKPNGEETEAAAPVPSATPVKAAATEPPRVKVRTRCDPNVGVKYGKDEFGTYGGSLFSPTAFDKAAKSAQRKVKDPTGSLARTLGPSAAYPRPQAAEPALALCRQLFAHPAAGGKSLGRDQPGARLPPNTGYGVILLTQGPPANRGTALGQPRGRNKVVVVSATMPEEMSKGPSKEKSSKSVPEGSDLQRNARKREAMAKIQSQVSSFAAKYNAGHWSEDVKPLSAAAQAGAIAALRELLRAGCDPAERDAKGYTPLMHAVWNARPRCVDALLWAGADVNAQSRDENTALHFAYLRDALGIAESLLENGAQPTRNQSKLMPRELNSELHAELLKRRRTRGSLMPTGVAQERVDAPPPGKTRRFSSGLNSIDESKGEDGEEDSGVRRPFRPPARVPPSLAPVGPPSAVPKQNVSGGAKPDGLGAKKLIRRGGKGNGSPRRRRSRKKSYTYGSTAAARSKDPHCHPAGRWASSQATRMPPLSVAALHGDVSTLAHLAAEGGSQLEAVDDNGSTALLHAVRGHQLGAVQLLLDTGANVRHANRFGNTALHLAYAHGQTAIARELLDFEADPTARNANGRIPEQLHPAMHLKVMSDLWAHEDARAPSRKGARRVGRVSLGGGLPATHDGRARSLPPENAGNTALGGETDPADPDEGARSAGDRVRRAGASNDTMLPAIVDVGQAPHRRTTALGTRGSRGVSVSGRPSVKRLSLVEQRRRYKQELIRGGKQYFQGST
jgi:ankyrin repeat protein